MVALTRNLDFFGSRFLTGLAAVFVAALRQAPAGQVRALGLVIRRHHLVLLISTYVSSSNQSTFRQ
jgi:hypothetical protein